MLFEILQEKRLVGFTYYPVLEIILGVFFLFMSFFLPLLFGRYNGFKFLQQWDEWLFLLFFFILFFFLGKNLAYQNMRVEVRNNNISLRQDMREPPVSLNILIEKWSGSTLKKSEVSENGQKFDPMYTISVIENNTEKVFYETRSEKEAKKILNALNKLYYVNKGEENGQK